MKKNILLIVLSIFFYSCSPKEVEVEVPLTLTVIENSEYEDTVPIEVKVVPLFEENILYQGELPFTSYVFTNKSSNIRKKPSRNSTRMGLTSPKKKMELLEVITDGDSVNGSKVWYKIKVNGKIGYIHSSVAKKRSFDFEKMAKKVRNLEVFIRDSKKDKKVIKRIAAYKSESKEEEGMPRDRYGSRGEQSIRAEFVDSKGKNDFRYLQDGRIVAVQYEEKEKAIVKIPDSQYEYVIDKKALVGVNIKDNIKKVIVIDEDNQVEAAFWKKDEIWELVGYNLVTTGRDNNQRAYDTPKGNFLVLNTLTYIMFPYNVKVLKEEAIEREEKRRKEYEAQLKKEDSKTEKVDENVGDKTLISDNSEKNENNTSETQSEKDEIKPFVPKYTEDDYEEVRKYSRANYGIRFSGGGYLHGIPLSDDTVEKLGSEEKVIARKKAGELTLGTYKASHKCVRNVEDFQSFIYYDFVGYREQDEGKRWRLPKENVAVIVF